MRIVFIWFLLIAVIYCACKLLVAGVDYQYEHPFQVDKDLARVEDFIIEYTKHLKSRFRAALNMLPGKSKKSDVCKWPENSKIFVCKVLIKLNHYGLKFFDDGPDELECGRREISLRLRQQKKLKTRFIKMFRCPTLQYISLDREEVVVLPVSYYISNTQKAGSACLYIQHGSDYPIFPLQIFSNFNENTLLASLVKDYRNSAAQEPPTQYVSLITYFPSVRRQFLNFMDAKRESKPYLKFIQLYMKSSTCEMPKAHKIYLCRTLTRHDYFKSQLDLEGYDEAKCRREEVLSTSRTRERFTMALFKCPPLYLISNESKQYLEHSLFLSTNSVDNSVIAYLRPNFKGKTIRLDSYVVDLDYEILSIDRRRTREMLKPHYPVAEIMDMQREILASDPPNEQSLLYTPFDVTFDRKIVEDNVIEYIEMRTIKEPYAHFQRTFATINVAGLRQDQIIRLCKLFLEEDIGYHLTLPNIDELNPAEHGLRIPIRVRLIMRDTQVLPQDKISSRQCPPPKENPYKYFLSASAQTNAMIVYVKYVHDEYYSVPEAFVDKIDKKILTDQPASRPRTISFRP